MTGCSTISIVDDDESTRMAVTSLVRSLGHVAIGFASAEEFLRAYRPDEIGCLVVDVQMPGMSGLELQDFLLATGQQLPIVFVTAYPEERIRERALAGGAVDFLSKPFLARELARCIESALQETRQRRP